MRDGRRNRLGLATGTAYPNDEDVSTTGIGSFINIGDLYTKSLADQNATTGNRSYLDRILSDVEVAGEPNILSLDPDANVRTTDQRYVSDAYNYYLGGGYDAAQDDFPIQAEDITGGGDGGDGGGGAGTGVTTTGGVDTGLTDFEQNLVDQGAGVDTLGGVVAPGEGMLTQEAIDDLANYPVNREYGEEMDIGYGEGQVDPNLAAAVGGKDTTPLGGANLVTLSSGDVFAADDSKLPEQMDYTEKSPSWWEEQRDNFINTGQDVGNFFTGLIDQGINIAKMGGAAIMNMLAPGLGLLMHMLPDETPIDKFNRKYQVGGDFYEDIVEGDPELEGRLESYYGTLQAGNISQDPFGKNTVSQFGDYPAYATETFNKLTEKAKQKAIEGKELSQFDKDRLEYYGHVSGLSGKTNIPETPLMVDTSPYKTIPGGDDIIESIERAEAEAQEAAVKAEIDRQNRVKEAEAAAEQRAIEEAARVSVPVPAHISDRGDGQQDTSDGGQAAADVAGDSWGYSPFRKGGRVGYGKGGIVDLLK